jgi:hypothetical protein
LLERARALAPAAPDDRRAVDALIAALAREMSAPRARAVADLAARLERLEATLR